MKSLGLIVEYNPMHLGHLYHLETAQKITQTAVTIAVMSGAVVQRGDFSIVDKFIKTDVALQSGIDIVVELPSFFVLQAADYFAQAAVDILAALGVSDFVFGSETGTLDGLSKIQKKMQSQAFDQALKKALEKGLSYPDAVAHAIDDATLKPLLTPNNTLGISYLKALRHYPEIGVHTIQRKKRMYYDAFDDHTTIQSATALRHQIFIDQSIDAYVVPALKPYLPTLTPLRADRFYPVFIGQLKMMTQERFQTIYGLHEGLENRFVKAAQAEDYFEFLEAVKTPRYTYAHLQRTWMHLLLSTPKSFAAYQTPPYIRLLGMTDKGQQYLHQIKKDLAIPLYTSAKHHQHPLLDFEQRISALIEPYLQRPLKKMELSPPQQIAK